MPHAPSARVPSRLAVVVALVAAALAVVSGLSAPAYAQATTYFVDDSGSDANPGTSAAAPFATLQKALDLAKPGTTINLAAGIYRQAVITKIDGTAAAPITIKGPRRKNPADRSKAVLYGTGGRVFSIDHSYYTLDGFTIDGQEDINPSAYQDVTSVSQVRGRRTAGRAALTTASWSTSERAPRPASPARRSRTCSSPNRAVSVCASATRPRTAWSSTR